jgi:hypothetical protein
VHRQTQTKTYGRLTPPKNGKGGRALSIMEYFIMFPEKCKFMDNYFILSSQGVGNGSPSGLKLLLKVKSVELTE